LARVSPAPKRPDDVEGIPDPTLLLRVLREDFVTVEANGAVRIRSNAFLDGQFETSCFVDRPGVLMLLAQNFAGMYVARVAAGHVRHSGYMVAFATEADDCTIEQLRPYHIVLFPRANVTNNENKRCCDRIRQGAELLGPLCLQENN
jgi:hypothetical protein